MFGVDPKFTSAEYGQTFLAVEKLEHLIRVADSEQSVRAFMWRICYLFHTHTHVANWITIQSSVRWLFVRTRSGVLWWDRKIYRSEWTHHWQHLLCIMLCSWYSVVRVCSFDCYGTWDEQTHLNSVCAHSMWAKLIYRIDYCWFFFTVKIAIFKWIAYLIPLASDCDLRFFPNSDKYLLKRFSFFIRLK